MADPVSDPVADNYEIVRESGDCAWDDNTNTLSFSGTTECVLTVMATKAGYKPLSRNFSIIPLGVFTSLNWTAFPASAQQDTPIAGIADPVSVPAADTYTVVKKSGDCAWDDNTKTLSFTGITECILTVTAAKAEYASKSKDFSITPKGVFTSITWPAFPAQQDTPIASPTGYILP